MTTLTKTIIPFNHEKALFSIYVRCDSLRATGSAGLHQPLGVYQNNPEVMWSYHGSKANIAKYYPKPLYDEIRELFCGSAKYSLIHFEKEVLLIDKYPVVIDIWKYLQSCSCKDILSLPDIKAGQNLNDFNFDHPAEKLLMGFLLQFGVATPGITPSPQKLRERPNFLNFSKKRIADNLFKIRHWKFHLGDYFDCDNKSATYFIDPPYQYSGHKYKFNNTNIDFNALSKFCKTRNGQVIVCENSKADWLDFVPMKHQQGANGVSKEVIWTNYPTHYNNIQQQLTF